MCVFISVLTHRFLFPEYHYYLVGYNPFLLLFDAQFPPDLASGNAFKFATMSFLYDPIIL